MPRGGHRSTTRKPGIGGPAKGASTAKKTALPNTDDPVVQRERAMLGTLKGVTVKQQKKLLEEFMVMNVASPAIRQLQTDIENPDPNVRMRAIDMALAYSISKPKQELEVSSADGKPLVQIFLPDNGRDNSTTTVTTD